jgi:alkylation response protein AidB-like acyl-CoA dehydrogenase
MNFRPSEQQQMIRDMVRDYARAELAPKAEWRDRTGTYPADEYRTMAELGLLGMNIPEQYGGADVGVVAYAMAIMEVAEADGSVAVGMSVTNMVAETILNFGNETLKRTYIPRITSGEAIAGAFALTEPTSGSDAGSMRTTADLVGNEWVLNGTKQFITSADHAGVFIAWARSARDVKGPKGVSAFAIPKDAPGLVLGKAEEKLGLKGSSTLQVIFDDCRIPKDHLLGEREGGFKIAMAALNGGRIGVASQSLGIGRAAFIAARDYACERQQFGKTIGSFQAIQWKLADMATALDAAELMIMRAAWLKENGKPYMQEASMAKVFATESANDVCAEAIQILGGYGYVKDYPVERYFRDCKVTTIYEGTSEIQRMVIARGLLET